MMKFSTIKKQAQDIFSFGLGARILNFFKGILLAYFIGANFRTDTYLVALSASVFLAGILAEGLIVSLVPLYQQIDRRDGVKGRFLFTNNLLSYWTILGLMLIFISYLIAPLIIKIFGPGFNGEEYRMALRLYRWGIPVILVHIYRAIFGGYLQSQHKFRAGAKGGVVNSIIFIIYLILFSDAFGLEGLMVAGIIAVGAQAFILAQPVFSLQGYRYKPHFIPNDRLILRLNTFLLPVMIGVGINSLNGAVDNAIGSALIEGTVTELNYADGIIELFVGLFIMSIITAIFPIISEKEKFEGQDALKDALRYSLRIVTLISVPAIVLLTVMGEPIVRIFYERGQFGIDATLATANLLGYYGVGIFGMGLILLINRMYYALENTITPLIVSGIALILNIVLDLILIRFIGPGGIALGTSIGVTISAIYGLYKLNQKLQFIDWKDIALRTIRFIFAGYVMGLVMLVLKNHYMGMVGTSLMYNIFLVVGSLVAGLFTFYSVVFIARA